MSTLNPFNPGLYTVELETGVAPGAGNAFTGTAPNNVRSQLAGLSWRFQTDANVADRYCIIERSLAGANFLIGIDQVAAVASKTYYFCCHPNAAGASAVDPPLHQIALNASPLFNEGDTFVINPYQRQAADTLAQINISWHVWTYPQ